MKKRKVISAKSLPTMLPLWPTTTMALLLDRLDASPVLWSVWGALLGLLWIAAIVDILNTDQVDLFDNES